MPFLCNGTLLFQGILPVVLPVIIYKYASCVIPYIDSFLFLCGEWSSLVFKDFQNYSIGKNQFIIMQASLFILSPVEPCGYPRYRDYLISRVKADNIALT